MRSPRSRSSINLYQRETVLCSWLGPRPVLSPQRARGHPSGSEREDEGSSVLGKHGPQSPASASAQQRAKKVKPAARKKDEKEKEKNSKKKKNKAKPREKSASPSQSSSESQG